jgi:hypothetical protein
VRTTYFTVHTSYLPYGSIFGLACDISMLISSRSSISFTHMQKIYPQEIDHSSVTTFAEYFHCMQLILSACIIFHCAYNVFSVHATYLTMHIVYLPSISMFGLACNKSTLACSRSSIFFACMCIPG